MSVVPEFPDSQFSSPDSESETEDGLFRVRDRVRVLTTFEFRDRVIDRIITRDHRKYVERSRRLGEDLPSRRSQKGGRAIYPLRDER